MVVTHTIFLDRQLIIYSVFDTITDDLNTFFQCCLSAFSHSNLTLLAIMRSKNNMIIIHFDPVSELNMEYNARSFLTILFNVIERFILTFAF